MRQDNLLKRPEEPMGPRGPLTFHVLQVQEDGVISLRKYTQLGHVGGRVWDGQPLPALRHVAPGQALRGSRPGRSAGDRPEREATLLFRDNQMGGGGAGSPP